MACLRMLAALVTFASAAAADDAAERLFREARDAAKAGDYATACPKFAESQRIEPAPGTLMNLADCEEHLGKIVSARDHFALAGSGFPKDDPRRAFVLQHAAELEKRFAHLTLRLAPNAPPGTIVRHGSVVVDASSFGRPVDADPGDSIVVVSAPGRTDRRYNAHLGDGGSTEIALDVGELLPARVQTNVKTVVLREKSSPLRGIGIAAGVLGLAAVGAGVVSGILAIDDAGTVKAHCDAAYDCDRKGYDAAAQGRVAAPLSTIAIIAGGSLVAIGTFLFFLGGRSKTASALLSWRLETSF